MNIVITGASSGIGAEATLALLSHSGANVIAVSRSADKLRQLSATASVVTSARNGRLHTLAFDIVDGDYQGSFLPFVQEHADTIDVLINNAGRLINRPFRETSAADFQAMFSSNVAGHVHMIQAILPLMKAGGHIVNIGSMGGFQGSVKFAGLSAYSASKAALHTLTECLAAELADEHIQVNCLALGSAGTEMLAAAFPGYESPVTAAQMGSFVADFALNGNRFFNGKIIPVALSTP